MAGKSRMPLQASPKFMEKLKEIQREIRKATGNDKSFRQITEDIVSSTLFEDIEKRIINGDIKIDMRIKMDSRRII